MCDIFPTFENFCFCINLKIAMLIIAMLAIVTGGIMMSVSEQKTHTSYKEMINVTSIRDPNQILTNMSAIIRSAITFMSLLFMFTGLVLLFAALSDQEGLIQFFVWGMFVSVLLGYFLVIGITFECFTKDVCLLTGMDWLSGATALVTASLYLALWIYFISVVNSYIALN